MRRSVLRGLRGRRPHQRAGCWEARAARHPQPTAAAIIQCRLRLTLTAKSSAVRQKEASPQAINLGAVRGKGVTSTTWRGRSPAVTPACHGFLPMARILQPVDKYAQHL